MDWYRFGDGTRGRARQSVPYPSSSGMKGPSSSSPTSHLLSSPFHSPYLDVKVSTTGPSWGGGREGTGMGSWRNRVTWTNETRVVPSGTDEGSTDKWPPLTHGLKRRPPTRKGLRGHHSIKESNKNLSRMTWRGMSDWERVQWFSLKRLLRF